MGKRRTGAGGLPEQAVLEGADVVGLWRTPVFGIRLQRVLAFLLPRLAEMAAEVPETDLGRRRTCRPEPGF
jgi:hypothetical protein